MEGVSQVMHVKIGFLWRKCMWIHYAVHNVNNDQYCPSNLFQRERKKLMLKDTKVMNVIKSNE